MRNKDPDSPSTAGSQDRSGLSRLRLLDFDDLFLLSHLLEGHTIAATARGLGLTQPAITQRVRKIERVFGQLILQKAGRHVRLTLTGRAICVKAKDALALMREVTQSTASESLTIGTEPLLHDGWLWPALSELKVSRSEVSFHAAIAAADEIAGLLATGALSAAFTMRAASGDMDVIELGSEEFVLVASPAVASAITGMDALASQVLLEIDRSFSLLARVARGVRANLKFKDVWFVGWALQVLQAVRAGHGVAILPERLVAPAVQAGQLQILLPEIEIPAEPLRLVFRKDRVSAALIELLAAKLALMIAPAPKP